MVREELIVRAVGEADHLLAALRASAARAQAWIASQSGDPLDLLRRMKFEQVGFHPLEDRPLNIIEQVNQTWTFVELSVDTPRNRFVRGALEAVARLVARPELRHRCRRLAADMQALGVAGAMPSPAELSADRIGRHDTADRGMLAAAKLAMDLVLPTEWAGPRPLPMPEREEQWARRLFERAVGGFYRTVLRPERWRVRTGGAMDWPIDWLTKGARDILPGMQTDIVLDDVLAGRRIVIDTKFTGIVTVGWRREATLRSGYLYQIYAYYARKWGVVIRWPTWPRACCSTRPSAKQSTKP